MIILLLIVFIMLIMMIMTILPLSILTFSKSTVQFICRYDRWCSYDAYYASMFLMLLWQSSLTRMKEVEQSIVSMFIHAW